MHIQVKFLVYYILILINSILGIVFFRRKRNLQSLFILLPISLSTELFVEYLIFKDANFYPVYHVYEVVDFFFFCLLFQKNSKHSGLGNLPIYLFVTFLVVLAITYIIKPAFTEYPSIQYSIESFFLIILSLRFLWSMEPRDGDSIVNTGMFWISSGLILSHSGIFIVNGSYNFLKEISSPKALLIKDWINMSFNYILYTFFIIGTLCQKSSKE